MIHICAYCDSIIQEDDGKDPPPGGLNISHGICNICEKLTDAQRNIIAITKEKTLKEKWAHEAEINAHKENQERQEKHKNDTKTV